MRGHWDTIAIIGVNLALGGVLMALCLTNNDNIYAVNSSANARMDNFNARMDVKMDAVNARLDAMHVMIYDIINSRK